MNKFNFLKLTILCFSSLLLLNCSNSPEVTATDGNSNQSYSEEDGGGDGITPPEQPPATAEKNKVVLEINEQAGIDCSANSASFSIRVENADLNISACTEYMLNVPETSSRNGEVFVCDIGSKFHNLASLTSWNYDNSTKTYTFDQSEVLNFIHSTIAPGMYRSVVVDNDGKVTTSDWVEFKRSGKDNCKPNAVIGIIDKLSRVGDSYQLSGWACQQNVAQSINVHLYVDGSAGTTGATLVSSSLANKVSESAISAQCGTKGVLHRFKIPITAEQYANYHNHKLWVHGIAKVAGSANNILAKSGQVSMTVD